MKTKLIYIYGLICTALMFSACNDYDWDVNHNTTLTPLTSVSGADRIVMTTNYRDSLNNNGNVVNSGQTYSLTWDKVTAADYSKVFYEVEMYTSGDLTSPFYVYKTTSNKIDNFANITERDWNIIAERAGIAQSSEGEIQWRIKASNGINTVYSDYKKLTLSRPAGYAKFPDDLYILGSATVGGDTIQRATIFRKIQSKIPGTSDPTLYKKTGEYNLITYLKDGEFSIIEKLETGFGYRRFAITSDNKLVEITKGQSDVKSKAITGNKMHRIYVDFKNQIARVTEVKSLDLWYGGTDSAIGTLSLEEENTPVWTLSQYIEFSGSTIAKHKYKFRMSEADANGLISYSFWGYEDATGGTNPTAQTAANYYYLYQTDALTSSSCYKFMTSQDKKTLSFRVDFRTSIDYYTHSVTTLN